MNQYEHERQVQMIWPDDLDNNPPDVHLHHGYYLRTYQPGDEARFFQVMELAGWPGWDEETLKPWLYRILPEGWFMAIHEESGKIVATAMATHNHTWVTPFCGEVGWTAADPSHAGKGLGRVVVSAVTRRFIEVGYSNIHLFTETWRFAALKIYLTLGYTPLITTAVDLDLWSDICGQLQWPYSPEKWVHQYK